jgi:hypothetical protein
MSACSLLNSLYAVTSPNKGVRPRVWRNLFYNISSGCHQTRSAADQ